MFGVEYLSDMSKSTAAILSTICFSFFSSSTFRVRSLVCTWILDSEVWSSLMHNAHFIKTESGVGCELFWLKAQQIRWFLWPLMGHLRSLRVRCSMLLCGSWLELVDLVSIAASFVDFLCVKYRFYWGVLSLQWISAANSAIYIIF